MQIFHLEGDGKLKGVLFVADKRRSVTRICPHFFSLRKRGDQRSLSRVGSSRFFESATKRKDVSPLYLIPEFPRSNILHKGVRILAAVDQARIFGHSPSEFYVNTSCKGIGRPKLLERVDLLRLQLLSSTRPASWTEICIIKRIDISSLDLPFDRTFLRLQFQEAITIRGFLRILVNFYQS